MDFFVNWVQCHCLFSFYTTDRKTVCLVIYITRVGKTTVVEIEVVRLVATFPHGPQVAVLTDVA